MVLNIRVPDQQHQCHPDACEKCRFSGLIPGPLNQKTLVMEASNLIKQNLQGDSDVHSNLRTTALHWEEISTAACWEWDFYSQFLAVWDSSGDTGAVGLVSGGMGEVIWKVWLLPWKARQGCACVYSTVTLLESKSSCRVALYVFRKQSFQVSWGGEAPRTSFLCVLKPKSCGYQSV